jgi:hypothetical protein
VSAGSSCCAKSLADVSGWDFKATKHPEVIPGLFRSACSAIRRNLNTENIQPPPRGNEFSQGCRHRQLSKLFRIIHRPAELAAHTNLQTDDLFCDSAVFEGNRRSGAGRQPRGSGGLQNLGKHLLLIFIQFRTAIVDSNPAASVPVRNSDRNSDSETSGRSSADVLTRFFSAAAVRPITWGTSALIAGPTNCLISTPSTSAGNAL